MVDAVTVSPMNGPAPILGATTGCDRRNTEPASPPSQAHHGTCAALLLKPSWPSSTVPTSATVNVPLVVTSPTRKGRWIALFMPDVQAAWSGFIRPARMARG